MREIKWIFYLNIVVHDMNRTFHYIFGYTLTYRVTMKIDYNKGGKQ
ncbi:hypothetical protein LZZ60_000658 [Listeria innocua]|nr:hypothetical protein [Listeria innocua]